MHSEVDIRGFYETHPYPPFDDNLDLHSSGSRSSVGNPRDWFHLYFPCRPYEEQLDILIAGCGMSQVGLIGLAARQARITAIDISRVALERSRRTKDKYRMDHVELLELPIESVPQLGKTFDLIYCTGVLHHLADPLAGLRALRSVLRLEGAINVMVYGWYGRLGLTIMQELLRRAGVSADDAGIAKTRRWIAALPETHPLHHAAAQFRDLDQDAGLADLLLNPRERSYTVPEIYDWLDQAGLRQQRFMYQSRYWPRCSRLRETPLLGDIEKLPLARQHAISELFRSSIRKHQFITCRKDRPEASTRVDFTGTQWLRYAPIRTPGVRMTEGDFPSGKVAQLHWPVYEAQDTKINLDQSAYRMFQAVDGRRNIESIIEAAELTGELQQKERTAREFFQTMWDFDLALFRTLEAERRSGPLLRRDSILGRQPSAAGAARSRTPYECCPLCNHKDFALYREGKCDKHPLYQPAFDPRIRWNRCARCRHVFTDGYFEQVHLEKILEKSNPHQTPGGRALEPQRLAASHIVGRVTGHVGRAAGRWLDVGFGSGSLLTTAAEFGYEAKGIDVRAGVVEEIQALGYEADCADLLRFDDPDPFDVISLADVLEHLPFPRPALARVNALLRPRGILFVSTPNMDSAVWRALDREGNNPYWQELEHYHVFTRPSLVRLLRESGFDPLEFAVSERYVSGMEVIARKTKKKPAKV